MDHYTDKSIFSGRIEWASPVGEFRAEARGCGLFSIYVKRGDAFIHDAVVRVDGKATPRKLEAEYLDAIHSSD